MKNYSMFAFLTQFLIIIGLCLPVYADWVTDTITVGYSPWAIAVNPVSNKIYVAYVDSGTVKVIDGSTNTTTTIAVGTSPKAVAVNPVTNKVYVANNGSSNVTVIDGATNATTTVSAGTNPIAVAVNPVTNKIYVANSGSNNVTVIEMNGSLFFTSTVPVRNYPDAVAVNPLTNKIYVVNGGSDSVTVINGVSNATATVPVGHGPCAVAVNPATNKIYVANLGDEVTNSTVTVIDGATNATTTVAVGIDPCAVAVNPLTNVIYVANLQGSTVTEIDGATNGTTTVPVGKYPYNVAVNPVDNKIYVTNNNASKSSLIIIDGATNDTTSLFVGNSPCAVAVNSVTNKIYVPSGYVTVIDGSTNDAATVSAGTQPYAVAMNPVTNKIYVPNYGSANVSVIDGATNTTTTVPAGTHPFAVAMNPVTNKIFVLNNGSKSVTVINGATNDTATVAVGSNPDAVAVNPVTNKIYVANQGSANVTVINGATYDTATVAVGTQPRAVAVNPVTNKIYVANNSSSTVTVIDGATNDTATVAVGTNPRAVAVNPLTNRIYVANYSGNIISVINGATNTVIATKAVGTHPQAVAVNPVTNMIYVANNSSGNVSVINGATNTVTATLTTGTSPYNVTVSTVTNKIYVTNNNASALSVIDGATNAVNTIAVGTNPQGVAVNPVTGKIYVANYGSANVTVINDVTKADTKVWAVNDTLPNHSTYLAQPVITGKGVNRLTPYHNRVEGVLNRLNTTQTSWPWANITSGAGTDSVTWSFNWGTDSLIYGENFVLALPLESDAATTNNEGLGSPFTGNLTVYPLYRMAVAPVISAQPSNQTVTVGASATFNVAATGTNLSYQWQKNGANISGAISPSYTTPVTTLTDSGATFRCVIIEPAISVTSSSAMLFVNNLAAPTLSTPSNAAVNQPLNLSLTWLAVSGATTYRVQMSTSATFADTVVDDSTLTVLTKAIGPLSTSKTYYWRVNAKNAGGTGVWSSIWSFGTVPPAAGVPVPVSPANSAQNQPLSLTLTWSSVTGTNTYRAQVATDTGFTSIVSDDSTLTATSKAIGPLSTGTTYYWHINAKNPGGTSAWSEKWSFATIPPAPGAPVLVSPVDAAANVSITPLMTWNRVSGAVTYRLQIGADSLFNTIVTQDSTLTDTSKTCASLANDTKYFWHVNATNTGGTGTWSSVRRFTTIVALPSAVTLKTPATGDTIKTDSVLLAWAAGTPKVDRYSVEYANDSSFATSTLDSAVNDTAKLIRSLKDNDVVWWHVKAHNAAGWGDWSAKAVLEVKIPSMARARQIPKTFSFNILNRTGFIRYALPKAEHVFLRLYTISGQLQSESVNMEQGAGYYTVSLQRGNAAAGAYLVVFRAGEYHQEKKVFLTR